MSDSHSPTTPRIQLDTPERCRTELSEVSTRMVELVGEYTRKRGSLATLELDVEVLKSNKLLQVEGANKEEREAKMVRDLKRDPDAWDVVTEYSKMKSDVDTLSRRIKLLEQRATNAANANNSLSAETKFQGKVNL